MKYALLTSFILLGISSQAQANLKKLTWLTGTWQRTNAKPGRSGVEIWQPISDVEMQGRGINLKGSDTTFTEKLKIIIKAGVIYYVADVPENKEPVLFKLTSQSDMSLIFEKPQHDFPKKISYELTGTKLKAVVSGDGKAIEYRFEKR